MYLRLVLLLNIFISTLFVETLISEDYKGIPPIDFKKALNINILPKSYDNDIMSRPISVAEIDKIKEKSLNYIPKPITSQDIVIIKTSLGVMKGIFYSDIAPKHCLNFKKLANSGFYDGVKFHRVIPNFMIQGGDILSRDGNRNNDGTGNPGWTVDAEFNNIKHIRGTISMARSNDPNSAGSQFFICLDNQPHLDGKYTAFGEIDLLSDSKTNAILDHIENTPTDAQYVLSMSSNIIPKNEDISKWIMLKNPKTKKPIYLKVPNGEEKNAFNLEMRSKLYSNNPVVPIFIEEIRVIDSRER
jgi:cyclophilin family peptidyl-prolyl cis-trans isomerase